MAKYKFSVNVDITSFKGGNVATTETVTLSKIIKTFFGLL